MASSSRSELGVGDARRAAGLPACLPACRSSAGADEVWRGRGTSQSLGPSQAAPALGDSRAAGAAVGFLLLAQGHLHGIPRAKHCFSNQRNIPFGLRSSVPRHLPPPPAQCFPRWVGASGMGQVPAPALGAPSTHPCPFLLAATFCQLTSPGSQQAAASDDQGRRLAGLEHIQGVL